MAGWDALLGAGSAAEQLLIWQVGAQVISDLLGPTLELVRQKVNEANPVAVLSPADLADAVVRGILDQAPATAEAAANGLDPDRFATLVKGAGEPPGMQEVLEMYRRGYIDWPDTGVETPSVERAIKTSRLYDYWSDAIKANAEVPISTGEAVDAYIRGQILLPEAQAEAQANGINADRFAILTDAAGRPPSLTELLELKRRNLIPDYGLGANSVSFQQGIAEGDTKNKWLEQYLALAVAVPPPRTVTALLRAGAATAEQAAAWFADAGLDATAAAAYVTSARGEKQAGSKQLAEATVVTLYESHAIDPVSAAGHLTALGYDATDAELILELTDLKREVSAVGSAITRTGNLYVRRKITAQAAAGALAALDIGAAQAAALLSVWDTERTANVAQLTAAQITTAWEYQVIDQATAMAELQEVGYSAYSAWVLLSNKAKGPLPGQPPRIPTGPGVLP